MARAYLERAIQQMPDNALLLATLADLVHVAGVRGFANQAEAFVRSQELRHRALALDDTIGPVHSGLGVHLLYWEDEFDLAGEELRRAVELSPDVAESHRYYGAWLKIAGRTEEALARMRAAVALAPNAAFMRVGEGDVLMALGRYEEAVGSLRHALRLQPRYEAALERLEMSCHRAGRHEEALDARRALLGLRGEAARATELSERAERDGWLAAREHDLRVELAALLARAATEDPFVDPNSSRQLSDTIIITAAELGEWGEAMGWIERSYIRRPGRLRRVLMDLPYDHHGLAVDPRYARLLRTAGLADLLDQ
jgi:tetratricopeptide (TPR) repeat protein